AHGRAQPIEPDEDQAICRAQPEPRWRRPLQDDKLLAEKCRFGLASRMRSEQSDEQSAEQLQEVKHPKARIADCGIRAIPDTIFGSHSPTPIPPSVPCAVSPLAARIICLPVPMPAAAALPHSTP